MKKSFITKTFSFYFHKCKTEIPSQKFQKIISSEANKKVGPFSLFYFSSFSYLYSLFIILFFPAISQSKKHFKGYTLS